MKHVLGRTPFFQPLPRGFGRSLPPPGVIFCFMRFFVSLRDAGRAGKKRKLHRKIGGLRYYNMDQVVGIALAEFERIKAKLKAG